MARKGSRKVRTGCHTCKVRKVKCDEGKPACERCVSTGRRCDGYTTMAEPTLTSFRFNRLFQSIERPVEGRALQFFCETAAKSLSGHFDSYFWTHLVLQFSNFEPAVRHCLLSISSLYEDLHYKNKSAARLQANTFALRHYNAAINRLVTLGNDPVILLVCILFVCIEVLQGNISIAMKHSKHGLTLLDQIGTEYPWAVEHLHPIFRRLTIFPLYFGRSPRMLPEQVVLDTPIPEMFTSLTQAQSCIDGIVSEGSHLIQLGSPYRNGKLVSDSVDSNLLAQQRDLLQKVNNWYTCFCDLSKRLDMSEMGDVVYCNIMVRFRLTRMWIETAFIKEQTIWDNYMDDLKTAINQVVEINHAHSQRPQFTFEVGCLPFVVFAVRRCRDLRTRLNGLRWIHSYGSARENMWDAAHLYSVCKRLIEIEHDISLDDDDWPVAHCSWDILPAEEMRPKSFFTSPKITMRKNLDGKRVWGTMVAFLMQRSSGEMWTRNEFLPCLKPMVSDRQRVFV